MPFSRIYASGGGGGTTVAEVIADSDYLASVRSEVIASIISTGVDGECDLDGVNTVPFATLSGSTYTAIRDAYPSYCRVRSGITLVMRGFRGPYCTNKLQVDSGGIVHADGANAVTSTGGTAFAVQTQGANVAGGAGGAAGGNNNGAAGTAATVEITSSNRFVGGVGGAGTSSTGGAGGAATATTDERGRMDASLAIAVIDVSMTVTGFANVGGGGTGGGGGGGIAGFAGGGGGASGGRLNLGAKSIVCNGRISANGGDGAAGGGSGAGGGGGGGGGYVKYYGPVSGTGTIQARGGKAGAGGGGSGLVGLAGLEGLVVQVSPPPSGSYRVTLTSAERTACITTGILDVSGTCILNCTPGANGATHSTSRGSGGFTVFEGTTTDGLIALRYDGTNNQFHLYVRGVLELSTTALSGNPATPCFQNWQVGDTLDWRIWFDFNGGARSMGIRLAVNHCAGVDTTGTAAGLTLAAITAAEAMGSSATAWSATSSILAATKASNLIGRIVMIGDSIFAPRGLLPAVGTLLGGTTGIIKSLASGGDTTTNQNTEWTNSTDRGSATVLAVVIQVGINDIAANDSAATIKTAHQTLITDIATQNPAAKIIMCKLVPARQSIGETRYAVWQTVNDTDIDTLTDVDAVVSSHVAALGDGNESLLYRGDSSDTLHTSLAGRVLNAAPIVTALVAQGVTP